MTFEAGTYRFTVRTDDGSRLYIDNALVLDKWFGQPPTTYTVDQTLTAGSHVLRYEYYEDKGGATAQLSWALAQGTPPPSFPPDRWKAEYFDNMTLSGTPVSVVDEGDGFLDHDWGYGHPPETQEDVFSARFTRGVTFAAGTYRFTVRTDDGSRLYIDDQLVLDQWHGQPATTYTVDVPLTAASHALRYEYYEDKGGAVAQLSWVLLAPPPPPPPTIPSDHWKAEYFVNPVASGRMTSGQYLVERQNLYSANGQYWVQYQPDNDLVLYKPGTNGWTSLWGAGSQGWTPGRCEMQSDGNLVVYDAGGANRWSSGTAGNPGAYLAVQDDGTLVIYSASGRVLWSRGTPATGMPAPTGTAVAAVDEGTGFLSHDWGAGHPDGVAVGDDRFLARWTRSVVFPGGTYRFTVRSDDGSRLFVDDQVKIDQWHTQAGATSYTVDVALSAGAHTLRWEYYEDQGNALAQLSWQNVANAFVFPARTDVTPSTLVSSDIVRITGLDATTAVSVSPGGAYRVCSDATCSTAPAFTSVAGTMVNGQYLQLRVTAAAAGAQTVSTTVTVGVVSSTWSVTTATPPAPLTLWASASPTQVAPGTGVTITAGATGGISPVQYKFWLYNEGTAQWTLLRDYGSGASVVWTPTSAQAGSYHAQVWARNAGSTADWDAWAGVSSFRVQAAATLMTPGQYLVARQNLYAPSGHYWIQYQPDNNLVLYRDGWQTIWSAGAQGWEPGRCEMQTDGNLVIYDVDGVARWDSGTWGNPGAYLAMQDDGRLVIYSAAGGVLWQRGGSEPVPEAAPQSSAGLARPMSPDGGNGASGRGAVGVLLALLLVAFKRPRRVQTPGLVWRGVMGLAVVTTVNLLAAGTAQGQTPTVEYYSLDALGSVRVVTDERGQILRRHDYLPFGEEYNTVTPQVDKRLFTGQERDADTGLDYFGARYYRPDLGRFTTIDPIGDGMSAYTYVDNNPLKFVDPFGLQKENPPGSSPNFRVAVWSCGATLEECLQKEAAEAATREAYDRFLLEHWWQVVAGDVMRRAGALASPRTYLEFYSLSAAGGLGLAGGVSLFGGAGLTSLSLSTSQYALWPTALAGPTVINGIYYTVHALERMAPVGLGIGRGVPVSVVENAIRFGTTMPGNKVGTLVHVFENVSVVTNLASNRVITVIVTGR